MGDLAEEATPQPDLVHGHLHHEERKDHNHHQVRQAHVDDAEEDRIGGMPSAPVDPDDQRVLHQAHHEDEKVHQEEGDAPGVRVELEGAFEDEPWRAVQVVKRVVENGHVLE